VNQAVAPTVGRAHQITLLTGLYAAQGLPFGFFTLALPVLLREAGWSLTAIGFLQFLALPWAIKFLWAPVLDHHGTRRGWLLSLQCAACVGALVLSQLDMKVGSTLLFVAVFLFNLIAASQDVVTDGLAVRLLDAKSRGLANGIQVGAYRLGMVLGGGLLLWLFARTSWSVMFMCMAALLAITTLPVWRPSGKQLALAWLHRAMAPGMLSFAGLIFCYRFGDQMVNSLIVPFLSDQHVGKENIALMKGALGSATSIFGAAIGGWLTYTLGRRKALLSSGLAQAAGFGLYTAVAFGWGGVPMLWAATVLEGVVGTVATVALFTLMMDASDLQHAGTDYTLLASVVVVVGSLGGIVAGFTADHLGYGWTFTLGTALSVVGCLFLVWWLDRHPTQERVAQAWR
jgi:PAT family beta-lactamase induction signal transducer AmpG